MGYILPVTNYQYINYQKRMEKDKQSAYHVDVLHKVILETKQNKGDPAYDDKKTTFKNHLDKKYIFERTYTQITGKGGHINLSI